MRRLSSRIAVATAIVASTAIAAACGLDVVGTVGALASDAQAPPLDGAEATAPDASPLGDASPLRDAEVDDGSPCHAPGGPTMVDVGGYCIDSTEVTQGQYAVFLAALAGGADAGARSVCAWKSTYEPPSSAISVDCRWAPAQTPNLPVVCVDWCDAEAFCRWAGKRLCGSLDGGTLDFDSDELISADRDAWYRACSRAGTRKFAYGATYTAKACNTFESGFGRAVDAGSQLGCTGGYDGLVDMVGNVDEHEDACKGTAGQNDRCRYRGGSWFWTGESENSCEHRYGAKEATRDARFADVGFRCCSR